LTRISPTEYLMMVQGKGRVQEVTLERRPQKVIFNPAFSVLAEMK